nr:hypothetical protein [uncultured Campylobacter sp.]
MFYITLRNKLRDYISRQSNCAVSDHFLVLHFHNFIKKVLFEHEITLNLATIQNTNDNASSYTNEVINTITKISIHDNYKFDTILIDEGQDFEYSWFKLVKDKFLRENGTFIIFANETQNIYERKLDEHKNCHTNIIGDWTTLNKTYRTNYNLTAFAKAYQNKFLSGKYNLYFDKEEEKYKGSLFGSGEIYFKDNFNYDDIVKVFNKVNNEIEQVHQNNIAIIGENINLLQKLDEQIRVKTGRKTITTFPTIEIEKKILYKIDKDIHIKLNSPLERHIKQKYDPSSTNKSLNDKITKKINFLL